MKELEDKIKELESIIELRDSDEWQNEPMRKYDQLDYTWNFCGVSSEYEGRL